MKFTRLTLVLAVSIGFASSDSSRLRAQGCACGAHSTGRAAGCDDAKCCKQCDDKGLLDALGLVTSQLDSRVSQRLANLASSMRPRFGGGQCDSACDTHSNAQCPHCSSGHSTSPRTYLPVVPPLLPEKPHSVPEAAPQQYQFPPGAPHEIPVPPPFNDPQPGDSIIDPFRDDSARSGQPSKMRAKSVGRVRQASADETQAPMPPLTDSSFSNSRPSATRYDARRSISDTNQKSAAADYRLSTGSSRRSAQAPAPSSFHVGASSANHVPEIGEPSAHSQSSVTTPFSSGRNPTPTSPVIHASAAIPLEPASHRASQIHQAGYELSTADPINPLRQR